MNKILKFIFEQWQKDRLEGRAEIAAHSHFCDLSTYSADESNENGEYLYRAMREVTERAFLAGFNTAVGLKDLIDGKEVD